MENRNKERHLEALIRKAGKYLQGQQTRAKIVRMKGARDYALRQDIGSQEIILKGLRKIFPEIRILSEEMANADQIPDMEGLWAIVDPLDGTGNYRVGLPLWGVSIGIYLDGVPIMAMVYLPCLDGLLCGWTKGKPTWWKRNGRRTTAGASHRTKHVELRFAPETGPKHEWGGRAVELAGTRAKSPVVICSTVVGGTWVATGFVDGFSHQKPTPFDVGAIGPLIQGAGGRVTDSEGKKRNLFRGTFVATSGARGVHKRFLKIINDAQEGWGGSA